MNLIEGTFILSVIITQNLDYQAISFNLSVVFKFHNVIIPCVYILYIFGQRKQKRVLSSTVYLMTYDVNNSFLLKSKDTFLLFQFNKINRRIYLCLDKTTFPTINMIFVAALVFVACKLLIIWFRFLVYIELKCSLRVCFISGSTLTFLTESLKWLDTKEKVN